MHIPLAARILFMLVSVSGRPWWLSFFPRSYCSKGAEVFCSNDCSQVMVCLGVGLGGFLSVPVATCDAQRGMKCSTVNKTCVPADQSDCLGLKDVGFGFRCHDSGSFPDPYDCQKFHVCLECAGCSASFSCHGTSAYDPLSGECSLTKSDRVCTEGPIEPCSQLGQMGVVQENPRIYYVCMQKGSGIVAEMYLCPSRMIFNLTLASCVETSSTTLSWGGTTTGPPRWTDTTAVSPSTKWTSRHSHGRHGEERRRWRYQSRRYHWANTSTVPTSILPGVTLNEGESTTIPPWRTQSGRLSHRHRYSGRRQHSWSQQGRRRWADTTTDLPSVTTGGEHSTMVPWEKLHRTVLPGLTGDVTMAPQATPINVDNTAALLLTTSGGVDPSRLPLTKADTTMIPPWTMIGKADTAENSPFVALGVVDTTTTQQAIPGGADATEVPSQATLVRVDTTVAPLVNNREFPVMVDGESSRPLIPWATVDTRTIPSATAEEAVILVT